MMIAAARACLIFCGGLMFATPSIGADVHLRLHGSNTLGSKLAPSLLETYAQARGFQDVVSAETAPAEFTVSGQHADGSRFLGVVKAHGTNTGFEDLLAGRADLWMASRAATDAEAAAGAAIGALHSISQEHVVALDGLAIAVHPDNPVHALSVANVRDAFTGKIVNWSQLGGADRPIKLYARDTNSGTFDSFKSMVLDQGASLTPSAKRFESSTALEKAIAADPDSLGFVGFSFIASAKSLAVFEGATRPLEPDALSVATEDYLLSRRLYFYNGAAASADAVAFIEFVLGAGGQAVAAQVGFVSQNIFIAEQAPPDGQPTGYYDLAQASERLSLNFRFRPQSSVLDSRALRDIDRLSLFMAEPSNRNKQLRLAAFGTQIGDGASIMALFSVNDRVDHIAQLLGIKGVATYMSRGFVGGIPVAPVDRADGRARNERVEVWIHDPKA